MALNSAPLFHDVTVLSAYLDGRIASSDGLRCYNYLGAIYVNYFEVSAVIQARPVTKGPNAEIGTSGHVSGRQ